MPTTILQRTLELENLAKSTPALSAIYNNAPLKTGKDAGGRYANGSSKIRTILKKITHFERDEQALVDFRNPDAVTDILRLPPSAGRDPVKDNTVSVHLKTLATFIKIAPENVLETCFGIAPADRVLLTADITGLYHVKAKTLNREYDLARNAGNVNVELPTEEQYEAFVAEVGERVDRFVDSVYYSPADVDAFQQDAVVILKDQLPDMRGGATYATMKISEYSDKENFVVFAEQQRKIVFVYNQFKTSDYMGSVVHYVSEGMRLYKVVKKLIDISRASSTNFLFYQHVRKRPFDSSSFNQLIRDAHSPLGIGQRLIRIYDATLHYNPNLTLDEQSIRASASGHSFLERLRYIKNTNGITDISVDDF